VNSFTLEPTFHRYRFVVQPKRGFRFAVDSVILGHAVRSIDAFSVVELGAGSGIVALSMYSHGIGKQFWLVENDSVMCEALKMTIALNDLEHAFHVICDDITLLGDLKDWADVVIFNPPFYLKGQARGDKALVGDPMLFLNVAFRIVSQHGVISYIIDSHMLNVMEKQEQRLGLSTVYIGHYYSKKGRGRVIKVLSKELIHVPFVEYVGINSDRVKSFYYDGGV